MGKRAPVQDVALRHTVRRGLGLLRHNLVAASTLRRYRMHAMWFLQWVLLSGISIGNNFEELNDQLEDYLEFLWDSNCALSIASNTLSGVQYLVKGRGHFVNAWRLHSVWRNKEPPVRAPPMSQTMVLAMSMYALQKQEIGFALSLMLGFHCFLRTGELLALTKRHIVFNHDVQRAVITLGWTKGGKRRGHQEYVVLEDERTLRFLWHVLQSHDDGHLICDCSATTWRLKYDRTVEALGMSWLGIKPYSLRRGGSTWFFQQCGSLDLTMERGRWAHSKTSQSYIMEGVAAMQTACLPSELENNWSYLAKLWG